MQKGLEIEIVLRDKIIPLLMEYFGGKSKIVEELFQGTDYKVTFNTVTYEWDISPKSSE
jgi:5-methylcytosine-specific restriction protein B